MYLSHKIRLRPTSKQADYFERAAGTARFVWNWALAEWKRQYAAGQKPNGMALRKQFNAVKYANFPWLIEIHRDCHSQPFTHLQRAWSRFFAERKAGKQAKEPSFKKKGRCRDSFYVANDAFRLHDRVVRLPKIGKVRMAECLRFRGKIMGATVSKTADNWFIAVQVEVGDASASRRRTGNGVIGVDLGVKTAITLSTGELISGPRPLMAELRRLRLRARRLSRKITAAKCKAGFDRNVRLPKGVRLEASKNWRKASATLARLHARIGNIRADFTHKVTTRLCRENQAVVIEDLHVAGIVTNPRLGQALHDRSFGSFRRILEYKTILYRSTLYIADRWYASSQLCSACGSQNDSLTLRVRHWRCIQCGAQHDRDHNAAKNLQRLASRTALPVATPYGNSGAGIERLSVLDGKVTPVRNECGLQDTSGQEKNGKCS